MSSKEKDGNWFKRHKILTVILAVIAIGIIATAANGGSTSNSSGGGTSNTPTDTKTEEAKPQKLSLQETFDKIESGMAKAEVESIIGKDSGVCSVTEDKVIGKMESCTYGGGIFDSGMLLITYENDQVYNKTIASQ